MLWLVAYAVLLAAVVGAMVRVRSDVAKVFGTQAAQAEWNTWRADAKQLSDGAGPVKRRVPKSVEPPALVLMRDHFAVCLGLALLLSTVLFGTFMFFARGALSSSGP